MSGSASTSDEVGYYAFSGRPNSVARRLYALSANVVRPCFYVLLIQGDGLAEVRIFERAALSDGEGTVAVWEGSEVGSLPARVVELMMGDVGADGSVAAVKDLLLGHGPFTDLGVVPAPPTARGAFGHPMRRYAANAQIRVIVVTVGPAG